MTNKGHSTIKIVAKQKYWFPTGSLIGHWQQYPKVWSTKTGLDGAHM